jgi:tripartite-type tricarboxylate transporter receptor subunit TctC
MGWTTAEEATMRIRALLTSILVTMCATAVQADSWPAHPLRMVVPVAAGSTTDIIPRAVVEQLSAQLGQPIVVENRAGAGGTIGSAHVARSEPDGYTLLAYGSAHTIAPALYAGLTYDPARDFAAVVPLGISPAVLVVSPSSGYRTVAELIAAGKRKPGGLTFSSVGVGSATHLSAERFLASAGIEAVHIPFKGGAEAMMEVVAGRCDFFFSPLGLAVPQLRAGKVVPLVVNGARRAEVLLDVPTMREAGLADAEYPIWFGLFAPAKTPREVVDRLNRETQKALQSPGLRDRLAQMGLDPMPMSPDEFQVFVRNEVAVNAALVKRAGIKAQ